MIIYGIVSIKMATLLNKFPRSMGCPTQNFIAFNKEQRDDYVKRHIMSCDVYISAYSFSALTEEDELDRSSAIIDKVFFDFDSEHWFSDMLKIHNWCKDSGILHRCHSSGNGAHVFIFLKPNINFKSIAIGNFQRWIQDKLDLEIDPKIIGDTSRIFRYPNTWNFRAGRWCIPISSDILNQKKLTQKKVWKLSSKQNFENAWCNSKLLDISKFDNDTMMFMDKEIGSIDLNEINEGIATTYPNFPPCIQQLLSTPTIINDQKFYLVLYLKDQIVTTVPFSNKDIISILKKTLSKDEFYHYFSTKKLRGHAGHNGIKFRSIYKRDYYMPNCNKMRDKGLCPGDCGKDNPINKD